LRELYLTDHKIGLGWRKLGKQDFIEELLFWNLLDVKATCKIIIFAYTLDRYE